MASRVRNYFQNIRHGPAQRPSPASTALVATPRTLMQQYAKSAWQAFKMVSSNIEKFLDGTPFKLPVGVLNTLIGITETMIDYRESIAVVLAPIGQRLEIVSRGLEREGHLDGVDSTCERFSKILEGAVRELREMFKSGLLKRLINSDEHPQRLLDIFRRIDEGTKNFQLELTLANVRAVNGITQHAEILRLRDLRPSREAIYAKVNRDGCVNGTRETIIEDILAWCKDDSPDCPPIYWLSGMAGTGKSTIAYTICEKLYDHGDTSRRLGASFFCSRQLEGARLRQNVIPTIAHDLAHSFPDFGRALLASKFDVQPPPLKYHIQSLLSGPWRSVAANSSLPPLVVVIDALDEVEGGQGSHFLKELIREMAQYPGGFQRLRFFVTSRQDPRIVKICDGIDSRAVCRLEEVPSNIIEKDIHLYLCTALPALDRTALHTLAKHASGLFIYAATAVRFIIPPSQEEKPTIRMQTERLHLLLRAWPDKSECGVDGLLVDHLYEEVLSLWLSPKSKVQQTIACAVLQTVICTEEPILVTDIPRFLESEFDVQEEEALNLILSLHAVLYVSGNHAYTYHKSFLDFITNTARFASQELATLLCPTLERQLCLAASCFDVMHFLRFNICDLPSSYLDDSDVADLPTRIDENIPYALRYACRHWAKHMSKAPSDKRAVEKMLTIYRKWIEGHLLFWIEAMNLLKVVRECYPLLVSARQWFGTNITTEERKNFIATENFITSYGSETVVMSTPHLYISALAAYTGESSLAMWRDRFPRIPNVVAILNRDIPLSTFSFGVPISIRHTCFLPDGIHILAEMSVPSKNLVLCDMLTGNVQTISTGHDKFVVSPDGKHIATSHHDSHHCTTVVTVWEVPTGKELHRLDGHHTVNGVIFSPDGTQLLTADQAGAHLWDVSTSRELHQLDAQGNEVTSVCFSHDGTRVASGSDGTVQIWNVSTGKELCKLDADGNDSVTSLYFSPDGTQVALTSEVTIQIWDAFNGNVLHRVDVRAYRGRAMFSPSGTRVAMCSRYNDNDDDGVIQIWDVFEGNEVLELSASIADVPEVCFSHDGTHIAFIPNRSLSPRCIEILELSNGKKLRRLTEQDYMNSICFSPDATRILSATEEGNFRVWDITNKYQEQRQLDGHSAPVLSTHFSPDGGQVVSLSEDDMICIFDVLTLTELHQLESPDKTEYGEDARFSADGTRLVWCHGHNQCETLTWDLLDVHDDDDDIALFDCVREGNLRLEEVGDKIHFWNTSADTGVEDEDAIIAMANSGSGPGSSGANRDKLTAKKLVLEGHSDTVTSVCLSPNGKQIVSGSKDMTVRIWDVPGMQGCQCKGSTNSIGVLPDGAHSDSCPPYHARAATWSFLDSGTIRTDWCIDNDGWVRSSQGQRYFWLPKTMHSYLNRPDSVAICAMGSVEVDFTTGIFGRDWAYCYKPDPL